MTTNVGKFKETLLERAHNKKIYICGGGSIGKLFYEWANKEAIHVCGLIDKKGSAAWFDKETYSYGDIPVDVINNGIFIITTRFYNNEIASELHNVGIDDRKIVQLDDVKILDSIAYDVRGIEDIRKKWVDERFRNKHLGKRAFLIGNGPSLRLDDLKKLNNEITFATNRAYQAISQTDWRPTYFFIHDRSMADDVLGRHEKVDWLLNSCDFVFCEAKNSLYERYADSDYSNLFFYKSQNIDINDVRADKFMFSEDVIDGIYVSGTTVYDFYQFAAFMGFKELYLIGMDFDFAITIDSEGRKNIRENFDDHASFLRIDKGKQVYNVELIKYAHETALKYAKLHGIEIYNASRGGKLDIFPRKDFDELFK